MGYFTEYQEPKATRREWAAVIVVYLLLWGLIYCMVASFTGWWPF